MTSSTLAGTPRRHAPAIAIAALLAAAAGASSAQSTGATSGGLSSDPSPYYIGGSQTLTRDTNVYRIPFGPADNFSTTSLLAGFDQPISRQRLFGTASVSLNRYQDEDRLNNTSYSLVGGLDWETVMRLSGNVTASLDQQLSAPAASVADPVATRNLQKRQAISGLARWGGDARLTLEARLGYSSLDYSAPEYAVSESTNTTGSLGAFYRPGSLTRVGIAVRLDRTRTPQGIELADGRRQANELRGRNLDLLADYDNGSSLSGSARLSYTRQTNSGLDNVDFSGLTGSINVGYRATAKISVNLSAARDAGFNANSGVYPSSTIVVSPTLPPTTVVTTSGVLYENNQVTNSFRVGATYAATAKISVSADARYARARIITSSAVTTSGSEAQADVVDESRGGSLAVSYAYSRAWTFVCSFARERREVSGAVSYGYSDSTGACSARLLWR